MSWLTWHQSPLCLWTVPRKRITQAPALVFLLYAFFPLSATGHKCTKVTQNYCGGNWGQTSHTPRGSLSHAAWQPVGKCSDSLSKFHTVSEGSPHGGQPQVAHNCDLLIIKWTGFPSFLISSPYTPHSCLLRGQDQINCTHVLTWGATFVVQSLSRVQLSGTPWMAACQASLSFTISQSLL